MPVMVTLNRNRPHVTEEVRALRLHGFMSSSHIYQAYRDDSAQQLILGSDRSFPTQRAWAISNPACMYCPRPDRCGPWPENSFTVVPIGHPCYDGFSWARLRDYEWRGAARHAISAVETLPIQGWRTRVEQLEEPVDWSDFANDSNGNSLPDDLSRGALAALVIFLRNCPHCGSHCGPHRASRFWFWRTQPPSANGDCRHICYPHCVCTTHPDPNLNAGGTAVADAVAEGAVADPR